MKKLILVEGDEDLNFYPYLVNSIYGGPKPERIDCPKPPPEAPSEEGASFRYVLFGDLAFRELKGSDHETIANAIMNYLQYDDPDLFGDAGLLMQCYRAGYRVLKASEGFSVAVVVEKIKEDLKGEAEDLKQEVEIMLNGLKESSSDLKVKCNAPRYEQEYVMLDYNVQRDSHTTPIKILIMRSCIDKIIYDVFSSLLPNRERIDELIEERFAGAVGNSEGQDSQGKNSKEQEFKLRADLMRVLLVGNCTYLNFAEDIIWEKLHGEGAEKLLEAAKEEFRAYGLDEVFSPNA